MVMDLAGLLRWYEEMGVDIAIDSVPHDRFAEANSASNAGLPRTSAMAPRPAPVPSRFAAAQTPATLPLGA
ncbi:MAG: uracil-DNA glycosylase, partial [Beijerinckiaceae bacterium]|nr:uracil-DNA glycosylase [Beijerinckiaceae bacterium]